ncbi:MAG TPA: hypothetical protein VFY49_08445 [Myxococcota bacterium]|nr:hypothetical protein [Myxococcota bacterium]
MKKLDAAAAAALVRSRDTIPADFRRCGRDPARLLVVEANPPSTATGKDDTRVSRIVAAFAPGTQVTGPRHARVRRLE